jgi:hypothetical protein
MPKILPLIFIALSACLGSVEAGATETVLRANAPYQQLGPRDQALSRACAIGRFNQVQIDRYIVRLRAKAGAAVLGVAKGSGLNLRDPGHLAKAEEDYFFRDDGTSSCEVFVGGRMPAAAADAAPDGSQPASPTPDPAPDNAPQ